MPPTYSIIPNTVPTASPPGITIYFIRNRTNNRVYVGQTMNLRRRIAAHTRSPPARMRDDIATLGWESFEVIMCSKVYTKEDADFAERSAIHAHSATGSSGYNDLRGSPGHDPRGRAIIARRTRKTMKKGAR